MKTNGMDSDRCGGEEIDRAPTVKIFGRRIPMPRSRLVRIPIGVLLIIFGVLGFLPILGFWMIPAGLLVLSYDVAMVRRWRRRTGLWWERRRRARAEDR